MSSGTQSVLDSMTQGILDRKAGKAQATGLTPVGLEKRSESPLPETIDAFFPNDKPVETIRAASTTIRLQAERMAQYVKGILECLDEVDRTLNTERTVPAGVDPQKEKERAADEAYLATKDSTTFGPNESPDEEQESFKARLARQQADAQASVFNDAPPPKRDRATGDGWVCPKDGDRSLSVATSRRGRKYRVCGVCGDFEKGD